VRTVSATEELESEGRWRHWRGRCRESAVMSAGALSTEHLASLTRLKQRASVDVISSVGATGTTGTTGISGKAGTVATTEIIGEDEVSELWSTPRALN
jgi:hypothetical protein